jgi:quinol monooxygenase YgiN
MIYANIFLTVKDPNDVAEIKKLLQEQRRLSLQEPGCERFEVYHSTADAKVFVLVERWKDQAALDAHRRAFAYTTVYAPKVIPRVDRTAHVCELVE